MIKAYVGSDTYESYKKAVSEASKLAKQLDSEYKIIEADEIADVNTFLQQLESIDMFNSGNIVLAKRLFSNKKISDYLTDNFGTLIKYDLVIWHDDKLDGKLKISKKLKDVAALFVNDLPKEREFAVWIKQQLEKENISVSQDQILWMIEHIGINKWMFLNEIEKIKLYLKTQNNNKIADNDLKKIMGFDVKGDIWTFLDAVGTRNKKKAIEEFEKLIFYEDNTQFIIAMLDREFRILSQVIYAKQNGINTSILGINPYVLQKTSQKSRNFTFEEIRNLIKKLFDLDLAIKSGNIEEKMGLTLLLSTL